MKRQNREPAFCEVIRSASPGRLRDVQNHARIVLARLTSEMGYSGQILDRFREAVERFPDEPGILLNIDPVMRNVLLEAIRDGVPGANEYSIGYMQGRGAA